MSGFGQYIYSVITASIIVSILLLIPSNKGAVTAAIRMASGLFLVTVVISPLVKIQLNNVLDYVTDIKTDASEIIEKGMKSTTDEITKVIKLQTESYILDRASAMGADIGTKITFRTDAPHLPETIEISGAVSPYVKRRLSEIIIQDLGIPEECQIWTIA